MLFRTCKRNYTNSSNIEIWFENLDSWRVLLSMSRKTKLYLKE